MKRNPADRGQGRKPVPRAKGEKIVARAITITESDLEYLKTLNPKNISAAIRILIKEARST